MAQDREKNNFRLKLHVLLEHDLPHADCCKEYFSSIHG